MKPWNRFKEHFTEKYNTRILSQKLFFRRRYISTVDMGEKKIISYFYDWIFIRIILEV